MTYPRPDFVKDSYILLSDDDKKAGRMTKEEFRGPESERLTSAERDEFFGIKHNTDSDETPTQ